MAEESREVHASPETQRSHPFGIPSYADRPRPPEPRGLQAPLASTFLQKPAKDGRKREEVKRRREQSGRRAAEGSSIHDAVVLLSPRCLSEA